jgi:hypothetical protein
MKKIDTLAGQRLFFRYLLDYTRGNPHNPAQVFLCDVELKIYTVKLKKVMVKDVLNGIAETCKKFERDLLGCTWLDTNICYTTFTVIYDNPVNPISTIPIRIKLPVNSVLDDVSISVKFFDDSFILPIILNEVMTYAAGYSSGTARYCSIIYLAALYDMMWWRYGEQNKSYVL